MCRPVLGRVAGAQTTGVAFADPGDATARAGDALVELGETAATEITVEQKEASASLAHLILDSTLAVSTSSPPRLLGIPSTRDASMDDLL